MFLHAAMQIGAQVKKNHEHHACISSIILPNPSAHAFCGLSAVSLGSFSEREPAMLLVTSSDSVNTALNLKHSF